MVSRLDEYVTDLKTTYHAQDFSIVVIPSGLITGNLSVRSSQEVGTGVVDGGAGTGARVGMGVGGVEQT